MFTVRHANSTYQYYSKSDIVDWSRKDARIPDFDGAAKKI